MENQERLRKTGNAPYLIALIIFFFSAVGSFAQDVTVEASVSRNPIAPNETVQLTVMITNSNGEANIPQIEGLQFLKGPVFMQNILNMNGRRIVQYSYTWSFRALKEGTVTIPEIPVRTSAGVLRTESIALKVSAGSQGSISGNFIVSIEPSKRKVFLGEPITVEYKVYQLFGNFRPETYEFPDYSGFWPEEIADHQGRWENQLINGQRYQVATLKITVLYPQKTGKFTFEGFSMTGIVGSVFNRQRVSAVSKPVQVEVLPLPASPPENFIGTYAKMEVSVEATSTHVKANEAVTLTIAYSGKGNLRLLQEPKINWPADLEVYDPEVIDRYSVTSQGISGKRSYQYLLIPRTAGDYAIPGIVTSWFDLGSQQYVKKETNALMLEVTQGDGNTSDLSLSYNSKSDVQVLNQDIRYIRPEPGDLTARSRMFFGSIWFYALFAFPPIVFVYLIFVRKKRQHAAENWRGEKQKSAGRAVRRWLKSAEAKKDNPAEFYSALHQALEHYALDKTGLDRSRMTSSSLQTLLAAMTNEPAAIAFVNFYEKCSMARFSPAAASDADDALREAREVIEQIESNR
jgi:hypothetical protein